ncbi:acyl-CoA reductase [Selenomonas sp. oral taxon 149]|uniref:acyl-CoA reductase n=1 Tax=Selenomonas sp. oral taxon 149 TaxID=712535 RepID=UPI0001E0B786|nr:acyl-CoA reductase [Selenomonas sp. oral taxon 149]EFM23322.1 Acyl-CoA reductase (LuxC) [Selenomonas sp. oral taxon 149 str. 67H29BP]
MRQHFDSVTYALGSAEIEMQMADVRPLPIFSAEAVVFLSAFSARILADAEAKAYPDVVTLGFWCRPAALRQMQRTYEAEVNRLGRGIVFHIAPSNVAVNFAYSCLAAFLAGNASIVRLPSKDFPQVDVLCRIFAETLAEFPALFPYFLFVRYGHVQEVNEHYSRMCQTRVVWGGDATIDAIRRAVLPPRTNEITFADRHSLAVIDADAYLAVEDKERIAQDFYNDTYLSDQNACTAPRFVVWLGAAEKVKAAQDLFWRTLHALVKDRYTLQGVQAVDKLTQVYRIGAHAAARQVPMEDNLITCVCVADLTEELAAYKAGSGFFIEYAAQELAEIRPLCGISCQTLSYYGVERETLLRAVLAMRPAGVDRIVPMGRTMDFALVWDGVDLIRTMSRVISTI